MSKNYTVHSRLRRVAGSLFLIAASVAIFVMLPAVVASQPVNNLNKNSRGMKKANYTQLTNLFSSLNLFSPNDIVATKSIWREILKTTESSAFANPLTLPLINGKIVFTSDRDGNNEIYTMNADGSEVTRLTNNSAMDSSPSYSPDGSKIVFTSRRDGAFDEIYVMNADGSSQTRLTNNTVSDSSPSYSPDGSKIVFTSPGENNIEIYVMNADGANKVRLTNNTSLDSSPSYSSDGSKIIFISARDGNNEIYTMNADGSNQTRITNNTAKDNAPSFSPDGSKIVFNSDRDNVRSEIYVMNLDGSNVVRLTNNTVFDDLPSFSPDGNKIAFYTDRDGNSEIYVMNADGSNQTRLTNNIAFDANPRWESVKSPPLLSINDITVDEPTSGTTTATFNLTLSEATTNAVFVDIETANNTAAAPDDFVAVPSTQVMFNSGETTKQVQITINSDNLTELSENFFVNLSNPSNATIIDNQGICTIRTQFTDNGKLVFVSNRTGNNEIFTMNADGFAQTNISNNVANDNEPAWSPDGSKIVFTSLRDNNYDIYTMNADGSNQIRLTTDNTIDNRPHWSPDGTKIVFNSARAGDGGAVKIYVMNADGTNQTRLTTNTTDDLAPKWSPDGTKIVFYSIRHGNDNHEIYVMNADGTNEKRLTNNTAQQDYFPAWSPDGSKIVFYSNRTGNYEIFVMNADGSNQTNVSNNAAFEGYPTWSPDGTKIVFVTARDGNNEIYTMNPDGSEQARLTNNAVSDLHPAWQPIAATPGNLQFSASTYSLHENDDAVTITVTRTGNTSNAITVDYATSDGTAITGLDYTATSGTLNFAANETSKTFTVPILDDTVFEGNETVNLSLSNPTGGATLGTLNSAVIEIVDNDAQPSISINDVTIAEPTSATATASFNVTLSHASVETITVNASTANNTATAPADYVAVPTTTLTFNPGETSKTVNVTVNSDTTSELLETFWVNLSNAINATITDAQGIGTIRSQFINNGKIVFVSERTGNRQIYTMNADGSNQTNVSNTTATDDHPAWSPDGSKIVFYSNRSGNIDLYTMNANGSNQVRLTTDADVEFTPSWSPDGTKIVFFSTRTGSGDIYIMNADGSNQTRLTTDAARDGAPRFSPDGSKIAFRSERDGNLEIYVMNSDGSNQIRLTNNAAFDDAPMFSPDGLKIAFMSSRTGNLEIFVMNTDGSNVVNLSNNPWDEGSPAWSPDGTTIAFDTNRDGGNREIYAMNADGTNQTRLTNNAAVEHYPWWQPVSGVTYSISGQVFRDDGITPLVNHPVNLSYGSSNIQVFTNANGDYSFTELASGVDYIVQPGNTALFNFTAQTFNNLQSNQTVNFIGNLTCVTPPSNLQNWYRGENNANDWVGGKNGSVINGTFGAGKVGQAFNFDGVDDSADLGTYFNYQTFTLSMWVRAGATQATYADIVDNNHADGKSWVIQQNGNSTNQYNYCEQPNNNCAPFSLTANTWQHLVVTRSSANEVKVYLDGNLQPGGFTGGAINYDGSQFLRLARWGFGGRHWNGQTDEFMVFNRPLSESEVAAIHSAGSGGVCTTFDATHSISGRVLSNNGTTALGGVTVNLSNGASTTTNAAGDYSFTNLTAGGNYTVTPSLTNYTFAPVNHVFNDLSANQTANFVGTLNCSYAISPTSVSVSHAAQAGMAVSVTVNAGCAWTSSTTNSWITIEEAGLSGNGNKIVGFSIAANTGPARTGTITIAGQTFTVIQAGIFNIPDKDVAGLIAAINSANTSPGPDTINLASGGTYTLTQASDLDTYWGPTGLPLIKSEVVVNANGATIQRSSAANIPDFRILYVLFADVTLNDLVIKHGKSGGFGGGLFNNNSIVLLRNSTVIENSGTDGGGVFNNCSKLTIENSTISHNTATQAGYGGGGVLNWSSYCQAVPNATTTISNSTMYENRANGFGGRGDSFADYSSPAGSITLKNSIVASPTRGLGSECVFVVPNSLGHNIYGDSSCGTSGNGDQVISNLQLGPLADYGGQTPTHALLAGSPAINAVPIADCKNAAGVSVTNDQRGVIRPQNGSCDIGSYEYKNPYNVPGGDVAALIAAINAANSNPGPDTINLTGGIYTLTAASANSDNAGLPRITSEIIINGNGATIQRSNAQGTPEFRILSVQYADLRLDGVTVKGGKIQENGGGIFNFNSRMLLRNSTITENSANDGGGIFNYCGALVAENSTISFNEGVLVGYGGGGIWNLSSYCHSTVSVSNSTIYENRAGGGRGDAIADSFSPAGSVTIKNSIVASPRRGLGNDCSVIPNSLGYNIYSDNTCSASTSLGDQIVPNLQLGALADNGGLTPTHALLAGSPAIDAIPFASCTNVDGNTVATDQRGIARPKGAGCDIGAVESEFVTPSITWNNPSDINYGAALGSSQLNAAASYNGSAVAGTFTYNPAAGTVLNAGNNQTLTVVFTPSDTTTFRETSANVNINVLKVPLTVNIDNKSRRYLEPTPVFTGSVTGAVNDDTITAIYNSAAISASPVGSYPITATMVDPGNRLGNYAVTANNGTLIIERASSRTFASSHSVTDAAAVPLSATVKNSDFGAAICDGSITFRISKAGSLVSNVGPVSCNSSTNSFSASVNLSAAGDGAYSVFAVYDGGQNHFTSSGTGNLAVGSTVVLTPTVSSLSPVSTVAATTNSLQMIVTGSGFNADSAVLWKDPITSVKTSLAVTNRTSTELTATVPATLLERADAYQITVDNTPANTTDGESGSQTFFVTSQPVVVSSVTSANPDPETNTATAATSGTAGTVSAEASTSDGTTATGTLTLAQYQTDPIGDAAAGGSATTTFSSTGSYFDVHISSGSTYSNLSLNFCDTGGTTLYWFDGSSWQTVSPQTFNAQTGCIAVSLNNDPVNPSSPTISQLTGTVIAAAGGPEVRTITVNPSDPQVIGSSVNLTASFVDPAVQGGSYTAKVNWGDGSAEKPANVSGTNVTGTHTYTTAGVYKVKVTVTRTTGGAFGSATYQQYVVVYNPTGGFVTGGGWINSPTGAYLGNPNLIGKANFGFSAKYQNGANPPTGSTQFNFHAGGLDFRSTSYDWLVVAGAKAQFKGKGKINGAGNYGFMLTAIDGQLSGGGGTDKFRIKIWDIATGTVVYDNQRGHDDGANPTTTLGGGSIVIHR